MDIKQLRYNFKMYMKKCFPNDNHIDSTISMAFFLDRYGHEFGIDFQQVLDNRIIPDDYRVKLEKHFQARDRKNPYGNSFVYERALRLLLEYIGGQPISTKRTELQKNSDVKKNDKSNISVTQSIKHIKPDIKRDYDSKKAGELLVKIGKERLAMKSDHPRVHFTGNERYDTLLNDLDNTPHTYVLACLMDKQIKAERAWTIPCIVMDEYGTDVKSLNSVSEDEYVDFFTRNALHRFNNGMGKVFKSGIQRISEVYNGDASLIWKGKPSSAKVVYDFLQFKGAGVKIATMAANILARQFQIEFADYYSIDVSPDVHIKRVMWRMGLIDDQENTDSAIYKARELNPEFPGIIDFSAWEIGREYCRPNNPRCDICNVGKECLRRV